MLLKILYSNPLSQKGEKFFEKVSALQPYLESILKGEYYDYTWVYGQNPIDYPVS